MSKRKKRSLKRLILLATLGLLTIGGGYVLANKTVTKLKAATLAEMVDDIDIASMTLQQEKTGNPLLKPFDGDDLPGNDSSADNEIIRSNDELRYEMSISTKTKSGTRYKNIYYDVEIISEDALYEAEERPLFNEKRQRTEEGTTITESFVRASNFYQTSTGLDSRTSITAKMNMFPSKAMDFQPEFRIAVKQIGNEYVAEAAKKWFTYGFDTKTQTVTKELKKLTTSGKFQGFIAVPGANRVEKKGNLIVEVPFYEGAKITDLSDPFYNGYLGQVFVDIALKSNHEKDIGLAYPAFNENGQIVVEADVETAVAGTTGAGTLPEAVAIYRAGVQGLSYDAKTEFDAYKWETDGSDKDEQLKKDGNGNPATWGPRHNDYKNTYHDDPVVTGEKGQYTLKFVLNKLALNSEEKYNKIVASTGLTMYYPTDLATTPGSNVSFSLQSKETRTLSNDEAELVNKDKKRIGWTFYGPEEIKPPVDPPEEPEPEVPGAPELAYSLDLSKFGYGETVINGGETFIDSYFNAKNIVNPHFISKFPRGMIDPSKELNMGSGKNAQLYDSTYIKSASKYGVLKNHGVIKNIREYTEDSYDWFANQEEAQEKTKQYNPQGYIDAYMLYFDETVMIKSIVGVYGGLPRAYITGDNPKSYTHSLAGERYGISNYSFAYTDLEKTKRIDTYKNSLDPNNQLTFIAPDLIVKNNQLEIDPAQPGVNSSGLDSKKRHFQTHIAINSNTLTGGFFALEEQNPITNYYDPDYEVIESSVMSRVILSADEEREFEYTIKDPGNTLATLVLKKISTEKMAEQGIVSYTPAVKKTDSSGRTIWTWKATLRWPDKIKNGEDPARTLFFQKFYFKAEIDRYNLEFTDTENYYDANLDYTFEVAPLGEHPYGGIGRWENRYGSYRAFKEYGIEKKVSKKIMDSSEDFSYTLQSNVLTDYPVKNLRMLDILPSDGDENNSRLKGTYKVTSITSSRGADETIYYRNSLAGLSHNMDVNTININDGSWLTYTSGELPSEAKALLVVSNKEISSWAKGGKPAEIIINIESKNNYGGDIYYNQIVGNSDNNNKVESAKIETQIIKRSIVGKAWIDANYNGVIDSSESILSGIKVKLFREEKGNLVEVTKDLQGQDITNVVTDSQGDYQFDQLDAGTYTVGFDVSKEISTDYYITVQDKKEPTLEALTSKISDTTFKGNYALTTAVALPDLEDALEASITIPNMNAGVTHRSGLAIKKEVFDAKGANIDRGEVKVGDIITYRIKVSNPEKESIVKEVIVSDSLVKGLNYVANSFSLTKVDGSKVNLPDTDFENNQFSINVGDILGDKEAITLEFKVEITKEASGSLTNTAVAFGEAINDLDGEDSTVTNNAKPNLAIKKTVDKLSAKIGEEVEYTLDISNVKGGVLHDTLIEDYLPKELLPTPNTTSVNGVALTAQEEAKAWKGNTLNYVIGKFISDQQLQITFKAKVVSLPKGGTIVNIAEVTGRDESDNTYKDEDDVNLKVSSMTLNIRQVVIEPQGGLVVPETAYYHLDINDNKEQLSAISASTTIDKAENIKPELFKPIQFVIEEGALTSRIRTIIPEYYQYAGYVLSTDKATVGKDHVSANKKAGEIVLDFAKNPEYYVTVFIKPSVASREELSFYGWGYGQEGDYTVTKTKK